MCAVPPIPSAGWTGGSRGGEASAPWTLTAQADGQRAVLASGPGSDIACVAGEFIDVSVGVLNNGTVPGDSLVVVAAGTFSQTYGRMLTLTRAH